MFAYSFDLQGEWQASGPDLNTLDVLESLCQRMAAESPTGRPWKACLLRIGRNGEVGADFERWAINPRNLAQRIAEFAAMPV